MPAYQTTGSITALYQGDSFFFWNNETPAVGSSSLQAALGMDGGSQGTAASVEISFAANPGVFEVDVQTSDTDIDSDYVSKTSINQANLNAAFVGRIEISNPLVAKFWRLKNVAMANAVEVTAKGTRG